MHILNILFHLYASQDFASNWSFTEKTNLSILKIWVLFPIPVGTHTVNIFLIWNVNVTRSKRCIPEKYLCLLQKKNSIFLCNTFKSFRIKVFHSWQHLVLAYISAVFCLISQTNWVIFRHTVFYRILLMLSFCYFYFVGINHLRVFFFKTMALCWNKFMF